MAHKSASTEAISARISDCNLGELRSCAGSMSQSRGRVAQPHYSNALDHGALGPHIQSRAIGTRISGSSSSPTGEGRMAGSGAMGAGRGNAAAAGGWPEGAPDDPPQARLQRLHFCPP